MAEQLGLEDALRERATVDRHERARRAAAVRVNRPRDQLLSRAALTRDQHRRRGVGRVRNLLVHPEHAGRAPDQTRRRQLEVWSRGRRRRRRVRERALDRRLHLGDVERLADVVVRAGAHRFDGGLQRPEAADEHHVTRWIARLERAEHVHPVLRRIQVDVGDEQIERLPREPQRLVSPLGGPNIPVRLVEQFRHEPARLAVVVNDQNFRHWQWPDGSRPPAAEW